MNLDNIPSIPGARRQRKRVGRGEGNGLGKTCGRGHKGQRSRSGGSLRPGFEGGQIPFYRRMPRRGFNNKNFRKRYEIVNVASLDKLESGEVTSESLARAGLVREAGMPVKILGSGDVSKAFTVEADKVSASARSKIEAAGGAVVEASGEAEQA